MKSEEDNNRCQKFFNLRSLLTISFRIQELKLTDERHEAFVINIHAQMKQEF